jgi:hypothetical protein
MVLQTTAIAKQFLVSDHAVIATDMNATIALQQMKGVFYAVLAEML